MKVALISLIALTVSSNCFLDSRISLFYRCFFTNYCCKQLTSLHRPSNLHFNWQFSMRSCWRYLVRWLTVLRKSYTWAWCFAASPVDTFKRFANPEVFFRSGDVLAVLGLGNDRRLDYICLIFSDCYFISKMRDSRLDSISRLRNRWLHKTRSLCPDALGD